MHGEQNMQQYMMLGWCVGNRCLYRMFGEFLRVLSLSGIFFF